VIVFLLLTAAAVAGAAAQSPETHTVREGETLYRVAQNYDVSVEELRRVNSLEGNTIRAGQELVIPGTTGQESTTEQTASDGDHVVEAGETLFSIAARYDISVDTLMAANPDINPSEPLDAGRGLVLPRQFQTMEYTVQSGNTLGSIARKYEVSVNAIRRANDIQGDKIQVGQVLTIPSRAVPEPDPPGALGTVDTTGIVQTYPERFEGRLTASGEPYDPEAFTASHPSLPFGSVLLLTHSESRRSTFVRVNDRGPVEPDVLIDISAAAARILEISDRSNVAIQVRRVR
jgi:LysM repeat protein